jgi:hypothetical protein
VTTTRISIIRYIGLTLGLALSISTVVTSSSFAYSARARQMCMGDAFRFCSSEIPNIGRIVACMRRNKANLSQGCRAVMDQEDVSETKAKAAQTAPVEHKPAAASGIEQSAANKTKPAQAAPVEQKPADASRVEQPTAAETETAHAAPVDQKPTTATQLEQSAATEPKPVQAAPVEQRPTAATPVEQQAMTETKTVAPVEHKSTTASRVEIESFEPKPASRGKLAKSAQRKHRNHQLNFEHQFHREYRSTFGLALPIPFGLVFEW